VDVDLASLRRKGIVCIQVVMMESKVFEKLVKDSNVFVKPDVLVKFKGFDFQFCWKPDDFVPDVDFIPLVWVKKDDGDEGAVVMVLMMMLWIHLMPGRGLQRSSHRRNIPGVLVPGALEERGQLALRLLLSTPIRKLLLPKRLWPSFGSLAPVLRDSLLRISLLFLVRSFRRLYLWPLRSPRPICRAHHHSRDHELRIGLLGGESTLLGI
jgi:hypothetical protein